MNKQEILNAVVTHLRKQGVPAIASDSSENECMYRTEAGLKCAAGCLIPDEDYNPIFEGSQVRGYGSPVADYFSNRFGSEEVKFIRALQRIHDSPGSTLEQWEAAWLDLAALHKVTVPPSV
jgi:hypothetical protein